MQMTDPAVVLKLSGSQASRMVMVLVVCALTVARQPTSSATPMPAASHLIEPPLSPSHVFDVPLCTDGAAPPHRALYHDQERASRMGPARYRPIGPGGHNRVGIVRGQLVFRGLQIGKLLRI